MILKTIGTIGLTAFSIGSSIGDYKQSRREGHGVVTSAAKLVGTQIFNDAAGWSGMLVPLALQAPKLISAMSTVNAKQGGVEYASRGKLGSGYFEMTQAGYTMRQRSLNAIHNNGLNVQGVLGNEARTYFRSM